MDLIWIVYLIGLLGKVSVVSVIAIIACAIALFCLLVSTIEEADKATTGAFMKTAKYLFMTILCLLPFPSEDTAYRMLAAYGVQEVAGMDETQRLASKSYQLIEKTLDKYIEEAGELK